MAVPKPDYLSRDYAGLRDSLLRYANSAFPQWQPSSEGDLGLVLLESFAYVGDILSYYTDRAQFENYLPTATQRDSVLAQAYLLGYVPNSGAPAGGTVRLETTSGVGAVFVPSGTQITTNRVASIDGPVTFETTADVLVPADAGFVDDDPGPGVTPGIAVPVLEGITESYVKIGESTGFPSQTLALPNTGVYRNTIRIFVADNDGSITFSDGINSTVVREWVVVEHLLDAEGIDTVFETQDRVDATQILFGDDLNGAIPATGLGIYATYRHGYGATGNVVAGEVHLINALNLSGVHVPNDSLGNYYASAMTGGADPESTESIRTNAPQTFRTQKRTVSRDDYIRIALSVGGVRQANIDSASFTSVNVFVTGPDGGVPSQALKDAVKQRLEDASLFGVDVTVADPDIIIVDFGTGGSPVLVEILDQYSQGAVTVAMQRELQTFMEAFPLGERLTVGAVYTVLTGIDGVKSVSIPVMTRTDVTQTDTASLTPRPWEVFKLGDLTLSITGGGA